MAKIILGKRPKAFKRTLKLQLPEGGEGSIEVSFVYRTRNEFGQFVDEMLAAVTGAAKSAQQDGAEDAAFSLERTLSRTSETSADYIMRIVDGWNLDVDFNRDNVLQLCDELPGVAQLVIESYRAAITEGRLGN